MTFNDRHKDSGKGPKGRAGAGRGIALLQGLGLVMHGKLIAAIKRVEIGRAFQLVQNRLVTRTQSRGWQQVQPPSLERELLAQSLMRRDLDLREFTRPRIARLLQREL